jgi:hypothetical protein
VLIILNITGALSSVSMIIEYPIEKPCGLENDSGLEFKYVILYNYITSNLFYSGSESESLSNSDNSDITKTYLNKYYLNKSYNFTHDNIKIINNNNNNLKNENQGETKDNISNVTSLSLIQPIKKTNFNYDKFLKICTDPNITDIFDEYNDIKNIQTEIKNIGKSYNNEIKIKLLNYDFNNKIKINTNDFILNIKPTINKKVTKLFEKDINIQDIDIIIKDSEVNNLLYKIKATDIFKNYINIIENIGNYEKKFNYNSFIVSKMKNLINLKYNDDIIDYCRLNNSIDSTNEEILSFKTCINLNRYLLSIISSLDYSRANITNIKFIEKIQKFRQIHMSEIFSLNKIKFTPVEITYIDDINSILNFYKYVFYTDLLNISSSNLNNSMIVEYIKLLFEEINYNENINNVDSNYIDQRISFIYDKEYRDTRNEKKTNITLKSVKDEPEELNEFEIINPNEVDDGIKVIPDEFDENNEAIGNNGYGDFEEPVN